jgi:hypothetical protein
MYYKNLRRASEESIIPEGEYLTREQRQRLERTKEGHLHTVSYLFYPPILELQIQVGEGCHVKCTDAH